MNRLHKIGGTVVLLALLAGIVWLGNANLGITAIVGLLALSASQVASGTLTNLLAGLTLRSEGHIRIGVTITVSGPDGPITGEVVAIDARVTLVRDEHGIAPVPNSTLTSSTPYIQTPPSNSVPIPPPPPPMP